MSVVLATSGHDRKIRFWDAPSGNCIHQIRTPRGCNKLEISPDKQFIAAAGNPTIDLYEVNTTADPTHTMNTTSSTTATAEPCLTLEGHKSNVTSIGFEGDGRYLYSGSEDGTLRLWDLKCPSTVRVFEGTGPRSSSSSAAMIHSVALRKDCDQLVSGDSNGYVKIWDIGGSGCIHSLRPSEGLDEDNFSSMVSPAPIQAVHVSEDSKTLVAVSNRGIVYAWNPNSLLLHYSHSRSAAKPLAKFRAHPHGSYTLQGKISPDGRHLVTTSSDGTARLWDTATWELTLTLKSHKWVWDAAFCADSSYLVTASSDCVARLWSLQSGTVVREYRGHESYVTCVALNDNSPC